MFLATAVNIKKEKWNAFSYFGYPQNILDRNLNQNSRSDLLPALKGEAFRK